MKRVRSVNADIRGLKYKFQIYNCLKSLTAVMQAYKSAFPIRDQRYPRSKKNKFYECIAWFLM